MPVESVEEKILSYFSKIRPQWEAQLKGGATFAEVNMQSLDVVRFIAYLQQQFRVRIYAEEYLDGDSFRNLPCLCGFIRAKIASNPSKGGGEPGS